MAFTAGTYTDADYSDLVVNLAEIFNPASAYKHLNRPAPITNALWGGQAVRVQGDLASVLRDPQLCTTINGYFVTAHDLTVDACTTDCVIGDNELVGTDSFSIDPPFCAEKKGSISEVTCKNKVDFQEKEAMTIATMHAALRKDLEEKTIAKLLAEAEDLTGLDLPTGALDGVDSTIWEIPNAQWDSLVLGKIQQLIDDDAEMINPVLVDSKNFRDLITARTYINDVSTENPYLSTLDIYPYVSNSRDMGNIATNSTMFIVDNAKIGFYNATLHESDVPEDQQDSNRTYHWRMPLEGVTYNNNGTNEPVMVDMYRQRVCVNEDVYKVQYKAKLRGGFLVMPKLGAAADIDLKVVRIDRIA